MSRSRRLKTSGSARSLKPTSTLISCPGRGNFPNAWGEAVRALVRIGLDQIAAYATPDALDRHRAAGGAMSQINVIDFHSVRELLDSRSVLPLDVRSAAEYRAGHVPGAHNIAHTWLAGRESELPPERTLLVYCRTGSRAAAASALLERDGFSVRYVDDRFDAWSALSMAPH